MNKIASLLSLTALAMGFVACDEVEDSLAQPSTNPQEDIFNANNLNITLNSAAFDMQALADAGQQADIAKVHVVDFPAGSTLKLQMQISDNADFDKVAEMDVKIDSNGVVVVNPVELDALYYDKITRNPAKVALNTRFIAQAVNGTEVVRIGNPETYFGTGTLDFKPFDPVEDTYYLIDVNNDNTPIQMQHSEKEAYDDPVFSIVVDVPADGYAWAIESGSTVDGTNGSHKGKVFVPVTSEDPSGHLMAVDANSDYTPGMALEEGPYKIEVNMRTLSYSVTLAIKELYTPGATNGWVLEESQILSTNNYINYRGFAHLFGEYRFASIDGIEFRRGDGDGTLTLDPEAKNLKASPNGLYYCDVNVVALTYNNVRCATMGVVGAFNSWGGTADAELERSSDYLTWTGTVDLPVGEFKFRANGDWGVNLGGSLDNLTAGGDNLVCDEEGTYVITLNLSAIPYTATMVKQ